MGALLDNLVESGAWLLQGAAVLIVDFYPLIAAAQVNQRLDVKQIVNRRVLWCDFKVILVRRRPSLLLLHRHLLNSFFRGRCGLSDALVPLITLVQVEYA